MDTLAQAGYCLCMNYVSMFCEHILLIDDHALSHDYDIENTCTILVINFIQFVMQLQLVRPSYCTSIDSGPTHWEDKGGGGLKPAEPYASYAPDTHNYRLRNIRVGYVLYRALV